MNEDSQIKLPEDDTLHVDDLNQFVHLLASWHKLQMATIRHHLTIPEGTKVSVEGEEDFVLEGDILRGFQMGLTVAINYLGTLPFAVEYDNEDTLH